MITRLVILLAAAVAAAAPTLDAQRGERAGNEREKQAREVADEGRAVAERLSDTQVVDRMSKEEAKHRERIAKLERLRDLYSNKNEQDRIDQVRRLLDKENARHTRKLENTRRAVGDDAYDRAMRFMEQASAKRAEVWKEKWANASDAEKERWMAKLAGKKKGGGDDDAERGEGAKAERRENQKDDDDKERGGRNPR